MKIGYKSVEFIPDKLEDSILYISEKYNTAAHKCCCGCGEEVITPLNPTDWSVKIYKNKVTLYPSIGNWSFACKSHYWIKNGQVIWSYQMTDEEIQFGRERDKRQKQRYFEAINQEKGKAALSEKQHHDGNKWLSTVIDIIKHWFGY